MRKLLLAACFGLVGAETAEAHWPLTYVGSPAIHRFEGPVHQVMLLQTPAEKEKTHADELHGRMDRNPECAIDTDSFLREPESTEQLFRNDEVFAPELNRPSRRDLTINGVRW